LNAEIAKNQNAVLSPLDTLAHLMKHEIVMVEELLRERASSDISTIPNMSEHIIGAGGKRLRPLITLASAFAVGGAGSPALYNLAAAVEFIHTATLLHDDVVDDSDMRRGKKAAKRIWGNSASILVGDFLFARAFTLMVDTNSMRILEILSNASCVIAEGEVQQLAAIGKSDLSFTEYMDILEAKTAALFQAAAQAGALTATPEGPDTEALASYGKHLGLAFQLVDDALDYGSSSQVIGKHVGDDFREGKLTLPVLIARDRGTKEERAFWDRAMDASKQTDEDLKIAIEYIHKADGVEATLQQARQEATSAKNALNILPQSEYKDALTSLADFCVDRAY
jgi:octaprenyl-diphosphate synthase